MALHVSRMATHVSFDGSGKDEVIVRCILFNIIYIMRNKIDLKNLHYISIHTYFLNAFGVTPVQFLKALEK